jgi:hypothetical protein
MNTTYAQKREAHAAHRAELNEALEFFAVALERPVLHVAADVLHADRSVYRLEDASEIMLAGTVTRTASMWKFESPDGCVFRSMKVDLIAVRAL